MHPLYPVARRMVGQPVTAIHVNGTTHSGLLQSVAPHGIYMGPMPRMVSATSDSRDVKPLGTSDIADIELVYSPLGYFAFGALTGLTLGALASRPYYGGYYGGYGGYY